MVTTDGSSTGSIATHADAAIRRDNSPLVTIFLCCKKIEKKTRTKHPVTIYTESKHLLSNNNNGNLLFRFIQLFNGVDDNLTISSCWGLETYMYRFLDDGLNVFPFRL